MRKLVKKKKKKKKCKKKEKKKQKRQIYYSATVSSSREISLDELFLPFHERRKEPINLIFYNVIFHVCLYRLF